MQTLEEAKQFVNDNHDEGVICPCCSQFAKTYKRKINSEMVRFLERLVALYEETGEWVHLRLLNDERVTGANNGTLFRHWGFIETESKKSGLWKPTPAGILFAKGITDAPKYVVLYLNEILGWSGECVKINDCRESEFNLSEAMGVGTR